VFSQAPLWLRESLIFPYLAGAEFVRNFARAHPGKQPFGSLMPVSTEQILHFDHYEAGDRPSVLTFVPPAPDTVRYEDDLGEFEIRLLLQQFLDDEALATELATGWNGDRFRVLGADADVLVWYTAWDDSVAAKRFAKGLGQAWEKRRAGGPGDRKWDIARTSQGGVPLVRLVDAPRGWAGWRKLPLIRVRLTK